MERGKKILIFGESIIQSGGKSIELPKSVNITIKGISGRIRGIGGRGIDGAIMRTSCTG